MTYLLAYLALSAAASLIAPCLFHIWKECFE